MFKKFPLYFQVLTAVVIGVLLGHFYPALGVDMKPFADGFITLIKMIIAPVIFCTVVSGVAGMKDMHMMGKTSAYALIYFEILSTLALIVGLFMVNWLEPGVGMNVQLSQINTQDIAMYTTTEKLETVTDFLLHVLPNTFVGAFAQGNILQILLISLLFGFSLHAMGERGRSIISSIDELSQVFFGMVNLIMKLAPLGAFGAMAFTMGKYGIGSILSLGKLMGTFYATCLIFIFVVLGSVARYYGFSIWRFINYIKEELVIVVSTSSSESVLPRMMERMEKVGVSKSVVGLVIPAGYSFNLDGTSIYLTMAAIFIAQATNTPLDTSQQLALLIVLLLTSKGAAGVTGSGFIVLAATLSSVGHIPIEGLALIVGIDRFMSEARALTNIIGNGIATIVVGHWCGQVDKKQLRETLKHTRS